MFSRCCVWEIDTPFTFKIVAFFSKDLAQLSGWIDLQWLLCWYQKSHHPPSCISYSYTLGNSRWRVCIKNNFTCLNASERHIRLALYLHYTSKVQKNFEFGAKGQKGPEATEFERILNLLLAQYADQWGEHSSFFRYRPNTEGFG